MTVTERQWTEPASAFPKRPWIPVRIRRGRSPVELAWKVEVWPSRGRYVSLEAQSLRVAIGTAIAAWRR